MSTKDGVSAVFWFLRLCLQFAIVQKHTCCICIKSSPFDLDGVFLAAEIAVERFVGVNC